MNKKIRIEQENDGIEVEWIKEMQMLSISGWYETHGEILGLDLTLKEFFDQLGITLKDCEEAFKRG